MPELLLELFSEEIPARRQARAADDLARLVRDALAPLVPDGIATFAGPRRLALVAEVRGAMPEQRSVERGPRIMAPAQALDGFLRKHAARREELVREGEHWVLHRTVAAQEAASLVASALPPLLRRFPWPKSMRWGASTFTWIRPLRRILCLLDGRVVPFALADGQDDGHGLFASYLTEGHRFHAPGAFGVDSFSEWQDGLRAHRVIVAAAERRRLVADGIARLAAERQLTVVPDEGLLDEVAGLVEWPVPLLGRIDPGFMDLPPEVMQVSMRVNQRYFALRDAAGRPAPYFAFAANIEADDGGAAIIAGNERVLRARFSDARHFWDLDRRTKLADRVPALDGITFHAKLGTQGSRVQRLTALAEQIAPHVGADPTLARRAALLAKADLTTGMVGEFPELQGVMGGFYARHDDEDPAVADAVRDHYLPKGPADPVPTEPAAIAVALADKLDQLREFFAIGEQPTGSGDPYALRRAALGVIRIVRENQLGLDLRNVDVNRDVLQFISDRLRVALRLEGVRHDVVDAAFEAGEGIKHGNILDTDHRVNALRDLIDSEDGVSLVASYVRIANILEQLRTSSNMPSTVMTNQHDIPDAENKLTQALMMMGPSIDDSYRLGKYALSMNYVAKLRPLIDMFFNKVLVMDPDQSARYRRAQLLGNLFELMRRVADFSRIKG